MLRSGLVTFIFGLFFGVQAFAQTQLSTQVSNVLKKEDRRFTAEWRVGLGARDKSNLQAQSKLVESKLDIRSEYRLTSNLTLDIQPSFRVQSGHTQSYDGADKAENRILLYQAAAHFTPAHFLKLSAGALNQRPVHTEILMDELAFPGARATATMRSGSMATAVTAEIAIPTATSLSTNTNEIEDTPTFTSASVSFIWGSEDTIQWTNMAGIFSYANLPSAVAYDSGFLGNKVDQLTASQSAFGYQFEGFEAASELKFPIWKALDIKVGGEYIQNTKAPAEYATGYRGYVGSDIHINKDYDLCGELAYYSIAPEAAVAYFNAKQFETNRVGYAAEGYVSFKNEGFKLGVRYSDAEVMYFEGEGKQSRQKSILIKLETFYANI